MTVKAMIVPLDFSLYPTIPLRTQQTLKRYVEDGLEPGGFLTSVLCNDLMGAIARADSENIVALKSICQFVYNEIPGSAWGSPNQMKTWIAHVWELKNGKS